MTENLWEPSPKVLLTMQQMGIPRNFVEQAIVTFREAISDANDQAFLNWAYVWLKKQRGEDTELVKQSQIPLCWQPSPRDILILQNEGYLQLLVKDQVMIFVITIREKRHIAPSWSALFRRHIRRILHPITPCENYDQWHLNRSVKQYLFSSLGFSRYHINKTIEIFKPLAQFRSYPIEELDIRFIEFIQKWFD